MTPDQEHKLGNRAAVLIIVTLCALCALASLSGCLTAAKIGEWQGMVYGWGMDPGASKPCQVACAKASAYLTNANRTLAEAGKLTDLRSFARVAAGGRLPRTRAITRTSGRSSSAATISALVA